MKEGRGAFIHEPFSTVRAETLKSGLRTNKLARMHGPSFGERTYRTCPPSLLLGADDMREAASHRAAVAGGRIAGDGGIESIREAPSTRMPYMGGQTVNRGRYLGQSSTDRCLVWGSHSGDARMEIQRYKCGFCNMTTHTAAKCASKSEAGTELTSKTFQTD